MSEPIRFFLPGPTWVPTETLQAMTRPVVGHRSPAFKTFYARLAERLPPVFRTSRPVLVATSSATGVMESAVISTVEKDVLNLTCGAFSERWHNICQSLGKAADRLSVPWGQPIAPELVRGALRRKGYEAVTLVHNETSTGVINPLAEIARVVREESDALLLVDTVSSLGGAPVETEAWGLDVVLTGSQKALALPPGITLFSLSGRAVAKAGRVPHRGFYTDLLRYLDRHQGGGTITTPAVSILYALEHQLESVLAEGMEARWARHTALQAQTASWAEERGFAYASAEGARSPTVSCLKPRPGVAAPELVTRLAEEGFTVGGGYGDWKPTTFRIGHMGEVRREDLAELLETIDAVLQGL
jgi:aspartate aminotransferase-like enzyme